MTKQPPSPLALALTYFRTSAGLSMNELARVLGLSSSLISVYERGKKPLSRERLESVVASLGYPPDAVDVFLFAHGLIHPEPLEQAPFPVDLSPEECRTVDRAAMAAGWNAGSIAAEIVRAEQIRRWRDGKISAQVLRAEEFYQGLISLTPKERHGLIEAFPQFWSWALAVRVCEASLKSAAHKAGEALELAELAVSIAERVPGDESWRSRLQGYCWAHVANALRVANDHAGSAKAFTRAWGLWRAGAKSGAELLSEWVLPSLEASLRRDQRQFSKSLELLDQAHAACGSDPLATGRILLKKEHVLDEMGDPKRALAALKEAAPFIEESRDTRLYFLLRFKIANNLNQLGRHDEAAETLRGVRALAVEHGKELDLIRLVWLESRVAAGQGRTEEAIAGLEQVGRDFTARELPYDAALCSLDLSMLWLKAGRTAEVRKQAIAMAWIFRSKGIDREALAALKLFCDAARQEKATLELARQVITDIEQARRSAPPVD